MEKGAPSVVEYPFQVRAVPAENYSGGHSITNGGHSDRGCLHKMVNFQKIKNNLSFKNNARLLGKYEKCYC